MTLLVQDGRRSGHKKWAVEALKEGLIGGVIVSPWHTAAFDDKGRNPAAELIEEVKGFGGVALLDATTHALLPGADKFDLYRTWDLWRSAVEWNSVEGLTDHVERVFAHQLALGVAKLTPTVTLTSAVESVVEPALILANAGRSLDVGACQSLAGTRSFWASKDALDRYVGELAHLRAPGWILTFVRDRASYPPDQSDFVAEAGFLRTVASLSIRSKVIVAHADLAGLSALAAGGSYVGTGWDAGQKVFSAESFKTRDPGGQTIRHLTYEQLLGRTRADQYEALSRVSTAKAEAWLGVGGPASTVEPRVGHFKVLRKLADSVLEVSGMEGRVAVMRAYYSRAAGRWASFDRLVPGILTKAEASVWHVAPSVALEAFADDENI